MILSNVTNGFYRMGGMSVIRIMNFGRILFYEDGNIIHLVLSTTYSKLFLSLWNSAPYR